MEIIWKAEYLKLKTLAREENVFGKEGLKEEAADGEARQKEQPKEKWKQDLGNVIIKDKIIHNLRGFFSVSVGSQDMTSGFWK